jgi:DNA-binding transcriptional LysR family regulator
MIELRQLRYFVAVAHHRHFTHAADELFVAQPAVSQQIRKLERDLGVQLFDRAHHSVTLTAAGAALLERAERILDDVDVALDEARSSSGQVAGRIRLGGWQSMHIGLPDLLSAFRARYPGVNVAVTEMVTDDMVAGVRNGTLDAAMVVQRPRLAVGELEVTPFLTEPFALAVAPTHAFARRRRVRLAELAEEPFITHLPGSAVREIVLDACAEAGFRPRIILETGEMSAARAYVAAGLGITILPRSSLASPGPTVTVLDISAPRFTRTSVLIWSSQRTLAPAAAAFIAFTRDHLDLLQK